MQTTYAQALRDVLVYEGGYVNHPKDPGGATNKGITQATYDTFRRRKGLAARSVKSIADSEVAEIYRTGYWNKVRGDDLPAGPDYATFDGAVNSGPARGIKWLQAAIGATVDGIVGNQTLTLARAARDKAAVVRTMCAKRMSFLRSLAIWTTFGKGWTRRVAAVEVAGVALALAAAGATPSEIREDAEEQVKPAAVAATKANTGAAGAGTAGGGAAVGADNADQLVSMILLGVIGVAIVLVIFLIVRGRWQSARAEAYRKAATKKD